MSVQTIKMAVLQSPDNYISLLLPLGSESQRRDTYLQYLFDSFVLYIEVDIYTLLGYKENIQ